MPATTINDISDLVKILKEQPEWAEVIRGILLNEEVINQIVGSLTQAVESLGQTVGLLGQTVGLLSQRVDSLAGELTQMREDYNRLEGRVGSLESRVERLECQVEDLKIQVQQLRDQVEQLAFRVAWLEGRVGNLEGSDYERKVRYRVRSRAGRILGLASPYLALTQSDPAAPQFDSAVQRAANAGAISPDEADDLFETDIIISAQGNRHVAVEVSLTAADRDITRAVARAAILRRATGGEVTPAIVTAALNPPQRDLAAAQGVAVFVIEYP